MTNVILPIMYLWMSVGKTIDMRKYDLGESNTPIYNQTDVVENPVDCSLNASYYVLDGKTNPIEKYGVPIDYFLRAKYREYNYRLSNMVLGYIVLTADVTDTAIVLVLAECKTSEETLKENVDPVPNWQDVIPGMGTHYADKIVHGGRVVSVLRVRSNVPGDAQVFRRILKDVLGTSGTVTANTAELWKKAEEQIRESPDVRGKDGLHIDEYTKIFNARRPDAFGSDSFDNSKLLRYVSEFPDFVETYPSDSIRTPLYVSFKPLHDLDDSYPLLQKDLVGERYLVKLYRLMKDLELADDEFTSANRYLSTENEMKFRDFRRARFNVANTLKNLTLENLSSYMAINKSALLNAFEFYQQALDNTTEDYLTLFRKTREKMVTAVTCEEDFLTPTRGQLRVNENEVVKKGQVTDFEECSQFCVEDERCRAVGYSEKECLVYFRSTYSATISLPVGDLEDMKIYDRRCRFTY